MTVRPFVYAILSLLALSLVDSPLLVAGLHGNRSAFLKDMLLLQDAGYGVCFYSSLSEKQDCAMFVADLISFSRDHMRNMSHCHALCLLKDVRSESSDRRPFKHRSSLDILSSGLFLDNSSQSVLYTPSHLGRAANVVLAQNISSLSEHTH